MITLIGKDLAKEGLKFIFQGPSEECESCKFKSSCVDSLELNRKYVIKGIRDNEQKCPIHDENLVIPVEVERAEIDLLTSSKSIFEGSTFTYNPSECNESCEFKDCCFPDGLIEGDKCIILKNNGKLKDVCKKGYILNKLRLAFVI